MMNLKRVKLFILSALIFFGNTKLKADEGMWVPMLIGKNYDQMKKQGFKLTPKDLYDVNKASLKDAIVSFGGFCTAELVSKNGLLFTNHHCGYDAIASESTPADNILDNGFYAKSYTEEKPIKGLFVNFLVRMEDVTDEVLSALKNVNAAEKNAKYQEIAKKIAERAKVGTNYETFVRDFYKSNQYFLYVYEKYTDIRLVGTPPQSIGKFGGDTDNWVWPRHTGDFSVFRIYAGKDNKPADYSPENVPFVPKKYLPVSIKGVKNNDFAMIYGFPGRTDRFLTSYGVSLAMDSVSPQIVKLRDIRLKAWKQEMDKDVAFRLKMSSQYARVANYWKYFIGQTEQLKRLKIKDKKQAEEKDFSTWAAGYPEYAALIKGYQELYEQYKPYAKHRIFINEGFLASKWVTMAIKIESQLKSLEKVEKNSAEYEKIMKNILSGVDEYEETYHETADKKIFSSLLTAFYNDIPKNQHSKFVSDIAAKYWDENAERTFQKYTEELWSKSVFIKPAGIREFWKDPQLEKLKTDIGYQYASNLVPSSYVKSVFGDVIETFEKKKEELDHLYMQALLKKNSGKLMYPDANSTMRISYGNTKNYSPKNGILYNEVTTIEGVMQKYIPNDDEFDLPENFIKAYNDKNYGIYGKNGDLVVNFISNNDITGGNSGSPVINGKGELIGLAFDGNWEAMSGDIAFDKEYKRSINVDIRYVLWCIDVLGGAKNIIAELDVRK